MERRILTWPEVRQLAIEHYNEGGITMQELINRLAKLEQTEQNESLVWYLAFTLDKLGIISDTEYFAIIGTQNISEISLEEGANNE